MLIFSREFFTCTFYSVSIHNLGKSCSLNEIISHIYSNVKTDVLKIRLLNRSCVLLSYANRPNDALQISFTLESEAKDKGDNLMLANAKNAKALVYYKLD